MVEERAAVLIDNYYLRKEILDNYNGKSVRFRLDYEKRRELWLRRSSGAKETKKLTVTS